MKAIPTLVAASLAAAALAFSASAAERNAVTDLPSAPQSERYVPFVTDFPSGSPAAAPPGVMARTTDGFDGLDAAFGAAIGLALGALAAGSLPALRRRRSLSSA